MMPKVVTIGIICLSGGVCMSKRGNGEGSVYPRCKKCSIRMTGTKNPKCPECGGRDCAWVGVLSAGLKERDGQQVRDRRVFYGATKEEVDGKVLAFRSERAQGLLPTNTKRYTVAEYLELWMKDAAVPKLQPVTIERYRFYIKHHINPTLGHIPLLKLAPLQIQSLYTKIHQAGQTRTPSFCHQIIHAALEQAVTWGFLVRNPASAVDKPRYKAPERQPLTLDQIGLLVDRLQGERLFALFYLALATGCRRGELCALRWQDIDWDRALLQVRRTAEQVGKETIFTEPKTAKSKRAVTLPVEAVSALRDHRRRQLEEHLAAGGLWQDHDLVFCRGDGSPLLPDYVSQRWYEIRNAAGCPGVTVHDLRHTHATILLASGESIKAISARLGHSTTQLTLDLYSHVTAEMQESVTRKLDSLLPSAGGRKTK
jgi:integrase